MICLHPSDCPYQITGVSYAGNPKSKTAMYITKKAEYLIRALDEISGCLVFVDKNIDAGLLNSKNCFIRTCNPQMDYARYVCFLETEEHEKEKHRRYCLTDGGFYLGENVSIGDNSYIEPGCLIGHDVVIGRNARILTGSVIKHTTVGDNFICNEYAVIGTNGFTQAVDEYGNKFRIPALGRVTVGSNVEVGAHDNISRGSAGDTRIDDYVKLDALVHIGHDAYLKKNCEITAGCIIGGFVEAGENCYAGLNSSIRNRIVLGDGCLVGMGSNVVKSAGCGITVIGNPARPLKE